MKDKAQVYLEFLIILPAVSLIVAGTVQYVLLASARSSVQFAAYNLARQLMMDPFLVKEIEGNENSFFNRAYFESIKSVLPMCPQLSERLYNSLKQINSYVRWEKGGKAIERLKTKLESLKGKGVSEELAIALDKLLYCLLFTDSYITSLSGKKINWQEKIAQVKEELPDFGPPELFKVSVRLKYPLFPFFGKIYCTWFTISKEHILSRIDSWIDEQFQSLNMYISDKINGSFDRVISGTVGKLQSVIDRVDNFIDELESYKGRVAAGASKFFAEVNSHISDTRRNCSKIENIGNLRSIQTQYNSLIGKLEDYKNTCQSLGREELGKLTRLLYEVKHYRDRVENIRKDIVDKAYMITGNLENFCDYGKKVEHYLPPVNGVPVLSCERIEVPCNSFSVDFSNYNPPPIGGSEYVAYFGEDKKALDTYNRITQSTIDVMKNAESKVNQLREACSTAVTEATSLCREENEYIVDLRESLKKTEIKVKEIDGKFTSNCDNFTNNIITYANKLSSVEIPDFQPNKITQLIREDRNKGCSILSSFVQQINQNIGNTIQRVDAIKDQVKSKCDQIVNRLAEVNDDIYLRYQNINQKIDGLLEHRVYLNPDQLLREKYQEYSNKFWGFVYAKEDFVRRTLRQKMEHLIPSLPQINIVNYKRCDPFLYYLGIYAVPITATEWVPIDFATLRGLTEDEIKKRVH